MEKCKVIFQTVVSASIILMFETATETPIYIDLALKEQLKIYILFCCTCYYPSKSNKQTNKLSILENEYHIDIPLSALWPRC